ncbi:hypothetical protein J5U23_02290 [Saccharolobus shibatae B12]|uniref:Uncharacterized protein n=1 Tax=Saccharolobus shibatae (strain ATCC 51178 / DSM 5389 / JCM 8931 / NBRC 15437 / B12) TaxID=523848 RepID=A0A8F5BQ59_SACSH|nr:hypothetical protein J5U23_02290 [Saccharolobus shibatae B12]
MLDFQGKVFIPEADRPGFATVGVATYSIT